MFCCNNPATLKRAAVFVFPAGTYCATNLGIKVIAYVMVQYQNNVILVAYTETLFLLCHIGIDIFLHWHEWELSNHLVFPWAQWTHCKSSVPVTLAGTLTLTRCFPKILAETQFSGQPIQSLSSGNQFGCWLNSARLGRFKQKWVLRPTYSIFGCRKPIWSRGHLLASFVQRPLLEMDNMQKAFQTWEPAVKDPLSNCISSHCILQMQFRIPQC